MILLTSELRAFKQACIGLKQNDILPILAYLKIDKGAITKNNLNSFVVADITYKGKPFVIEERILMDYCSRATGDITVTLEGTTVTLKADGVSKVKSETMPLSDFPTISDAVSEQIELGDNVLTQIGIASKFVDEDAVNPAAQYVFIGDMGIRASNGFIGYSLGVETTLRAYFNLETCKAISKLDNVKYSDNPSYHFFESEGLRYGFVKPEYKYIDISLFFKLPEIEPFIVDKAEWVQFNDQAIVNAVSKVATTLLTIEPGRMDLKMKDNSYNIEQDNSIAITGGIDGSFGYNPMLLNRILKAVSESTLNVYQSKGRYYFTGAPGWVALIMQLV